MVQMEPLNSPFGIMISVDCPLVRDPSFTTSSVQHSHESDTDSSTQTPQEALKPNQQQAVWTWGWNPGWTHVHKTNTGCWMEAKTRLLSGRPRKTCGSDCTARCLCFPSRLCSSLLLSAFSTRPLSITLGTFYFLFPLSLSLLSAWISWRELEMWRVPIYTSASIFPWATHTHQHETQTWFHVQKISAKSTPLKEQIKPGPEKCLFRWNRAELRAEVLSERFFFYARTYIFHKDREIHMQLEHTHTHSHDGWGAGVWQQTFNYSTAAWTVFFYKEKQTLMKKTHLINVLGLWIFHEPPLSYRCRSLHVLLQNYWDIKKRWRSEPEGWVEGLSAVIVIHQQLSPSWATQSQVVFIKYPVSGRQTHQSVRLNKENKHCSLP